MDQPGQKYKLCHLLKTISATGFILILAILSGCITREKCARFYPAQTTNHDTVKVTSEILVHDTVFLIPADSSSQLALLECNKNGEVMLKQLMSYKQGMTALKPTFSISHNVLTTKCTCDSARIHAILKNRETTTEIIHTSVITPAAIQVKHIPGWMWFFGITGMIGVGFILLFIIYKVMKSKLKMFL